jgi:hypothetical protein
LPTVDAGAWQRAAELIARAPDCGHLEPTVLLAVATQMQLAYGAADDTFVWWCDQAKLEIA